ncbi:hypothetical protein D1614_19055 [Maribellus luteus]|uniref:Uncharacterized protein n=1 Tax=Maribellus luteus TaxID=2305463 RepID=A0A399SQI9_9BACT|nr:hypothetical protein [Maribellus luteus]RIJ46306.1 hypothetical protein D1614_19055 [Maribellus luteus]
MSDSNSGETQATAMLVVTVALSIIAGIISWNLVHPHSFGSFIGFLIFWGVFSAIGRFLAMILVSVIAGKK